MAGYAARRTLWIAPVMLGVASITFLLMHLVPGGPWDQEKKLPPQIVENLNHRYGLDKPLWDRYWSFLTGALKGDLGASYTYQDRDVTEIIRQGFPATATLGAVAFLIAIGAGIPLGVIAAVKRNSFVDYFSLYFATLFAAVPGFVLGILLVIVLSIQLHLLPTGGWGSPSQVVMPAIALAALPCAFITRVTRASV